VRVCERETAWMQTSIESNPILFSRVRVTPRHCSAQLCNAPACLNRSRAAKNLPTSYRRATRSPVSVGTSDGKAESVYVVNSGTKLRSCEARERGRESERQPHEKRGHEQRRPKSNSRAVNEGTSLLGVLCHEVPPFLHEVAL